MNNQNWQSAADKPADEIRERVMRDLGMVSTPMPRWQRTLLSFLLVVLVGYALLSLSGCSLPERNPKILDKVEKCIALACAGPQLPVIASACQTDLCRVEKTRAEANGQKRYCPDACVALYKSESDTIVAVSDNNAKMVKDGSKAALIPVSIAAASLPIEALGNLIPKTGNVTHNNSTAVSGTGNAVDRSTADNTNRPVDVNISGSNDVTDIPVELPQ